MVTLAEALIGKGLSLRIYDKHVALARLVGANKDYIEQQISHLSSLMVPTIDQVLDESDVIVVGTRSEEFADALMRLRPEQIAIDLVRLRLYAAPPRNYSGICW
jgi:GDP-mannose 6-dehydrogenase